MNIEAPKAPKRHEELNLHEDTRIDPWFWLRLAEDPATMEYLKAENSYTQAIMEPTEVLQNDLYTEMRARIKEDDSTVPEKEGSYYYYIRFQQGGQYPVYCRKLQAPDAQEEVLLDVNELAQGKEYLSLGVCKNSPDHKWLAYSVDTDGSERYTVYIKDLDTGRLLNEAIPNCYYSLEWTSDSQTIFYDSLDEHHRPVRVFRHRLGSDPATDSLVYQEQDGRFFLSVRKSPSERFIYIAATGNNMSEWQFLDADHPESAPKLIEPRRPDFEYSVVDHGDRFLIHNNGDGARDFKVSEAPISDPGRENWKDFIPHEPGRPIRRLLAFKDHLVVSYRRGGLPQIQVIQLSGQESHTIDFDEEDYAVRVQQGREWDTPVLRFTYTSMTTPPSVYDYDMNTRQREFRKQTEVLGGFSADIYEARRLLAPARDGTRIPISIVYRKGAPLDGSAPLYLYAYGSYGQVVESEFSSARLSLVDRGFIFAIAHVRGGMEMGWDWYEGGKLLNKKNTFTDFIDCADYLIKEGYTAQGRIVGMGGSAGGMLIGAVVNMRPDLFKAAVAHVPFVDVLNTMLDDTLPLTTLEYNEWGDPNQKEFYEYIKSYSPYDNVRAQGYPHILVTAGISDPRVTYWEPAKWTARLRDLKTDDNLLLLKTNMDSGHAGASGRFERLKEVALEYAFILQVFGLNGKSQAQACGKEV